MITPWISRLNVLFIAAKVDDPRYKALPDDWQELIERRIFSDPDPATGIDRSLRAYFTAVSSGLAHFDATVVGPVSVPGCGAGPAIKAVSTSNQYDLVCVVFPGGINACTGMAILHNGPFPYDQPRSPNRLLGWCRFKIDEPIGVWIMEFLHAATGFGDLYQTSPHPGSFDEMACACGTHPSSFTKAKLGWLPTNAIQELGRGEDDDLLTLYAIGLRQPPPTGRVAAIRIPTMQQDRYFLVEARLRTDPYEQGLPGLSSGIPSEGVVIYEVDETVWAPMKLRTPIALGEGDTFRSDIDKLIVTINSTVPVGFTVEVLSCVVLQRRIEFTRQELEAAMRALAMEPEPGTAETRAVIIMRIHQLLGRIADLKNRADFLGCQLPRLTVETFGTDGINLTLPGRKDFAPAEPQPASERGSPITGPEFGSEQPAHRVQRPVDLW